MKSTANERIRVFEDTLSHINKNKMLKNSVGEARMEQTIYFHLPQPTSKGSPKRWLSTRVELVDGTSFGVAKDYAQTRVAVLNFADYYVPGGLVWEGSKAQEECLCRVSTLYPCISDDRMQTYFYTPHKGLSDITYTDDLIYTKGVIVFKEEEYPNYVMSYDEWFACDVITCAAPYNVDGSITNEQQYQIFKKRFDWIIEAAATNKADTLVLGAFGCGAFKNNPDVVARACYDAIEKNAGKIGKIVLAVPIFADSVNHDAFKNVFTRTYFERD